MSTRPQRYQRAWLLCGIIVLVAALQVLIYPRWYRLTTAELYQQAYAALLRDEKAESLRLLAQVHRRVPNIALSRFIAGWCRHCLSNYDAAIAEYRLATRYRPDYAQTYANMGYVLKELGRYDEAATVFTQHLQREPSNALSQAALDECRQRAASATGTTAQILFLPPHSNYYYRRVSHEMSYLALESKGRCRYVCGSLGGIAWRRDGTWLQTANGVIRVDLGDATLHAAVWRYRDCTLVLAETSLRKLFRQRDDVLHTFALRRHCGWQAVTRRAFETAIGRVSGVFEILADEGFLAAPVGVLIFLTQAAFVVFFAALAGTVLVLLLVRPRGTCPACGQSIVAAAVRKMRTIRCRSCRHQTRLTFTIPRRVHVAWHGVVVALLLCAMLLITTASRMPVLFWLILICVVTWLVLAARRRCYARWLFARIKPPETNPNATP